jgi:uncharacterized protein (DUF4415 family)
VAPKRQISVRLPADVLAWVQSRGTETQRSVAFILAELVRAEMAREAKAKKPKAAKGRATA